MEKSDVADVVAHRRQPIPAGVVAPVASSSPRARSGFWSFLRTFFIGTAGLALLAVVGTLGGSAWLTANQRAEAQKPAPWADPSFTTTAVTTGGLLARWLDSDGDLSNGHSYIKGIYDLWKARQGPSWSALRLDPGTQSALPQLWQVEFNADLEKAKQQAQLRRDIEIAEQQRMQAEVKRKSRQAALEVMGGESLEPPPGSPGR